MGNKLTKTLKTINEVNSIVNRLLNEEDYDKIYGPGSSMDFEEAGSDITNKLSDVTASIKGSLSQFKDTGDSGGFKSKKNTYTSLLFDKEGEGEKFKIHYDGTVKDIDNNDGSNKKINISGVVEYEIKGYGGGQGDVLKIEDANTSPKRYFLINFVKKVVNNDPNKGQIWWCKDDTCKTKGSSKSWKATSITGL